MDKIEFKSYSVFYIFFRGITKNTQQTALWTFLSSFKNSQQKVYSKAVGKHCAEIFKHSKGARNRVGIGLSYRPAGYTAWQNWFLGIDSWAPSKFKNSGSGN